MYYKMVILVYLFIYVYGTVNAICPMTTGKSLEFAVEYAVWRGWHQVIIQTAINDTECYWTVLRFVKCLSVNGIASSMNIKEKTRLTSVLGIVLFAPVLKGVAIKGFTSTLNQMNHWEMNGASYDWLIISKSFDDFKILSNTLNTTGMRFDQNIILALPDDQHDSNISVDLCNGNFIYNRNCRKWKNTRLRRSLYLDPAYDNYFNSCNKRDFERNYYKLSERFGNIARNRNYTRNQKTHTLLQSGVLRYNFSKSFSALRISNYSLKQVILKWKRVNNVGMDFNIHVLQFCKVRINSTLYVKHLGAWSSKRSMSLVNIPYPVEARNFLGENFIIGRCNSTTEGSITLDDDGPSAPELLSDILQFLALRLNATPVTRYYGILGFRTYEGAWTGLLGALMEHSVDLALEPVTVISPYNNDMDFIFPIADTMSNIYIRHQETSAVRDIFLAPFSPMLIAYVALMTLGGAVTIVVISRSISTRQNRVLSPTEGIIWSIGILCQQGGTWTPQNPAGSILLIVCLFFALITYNAYAAFITSVLSVRVAVVGSLSDVLESNYKIGYIRNGADQMYLMSTKDVQLNAFYIRGYSEAENLVSSAEEGLVRAASQNYAFFAGQRVARSTLRSLSQARGRCVLRELSVPSTRAQLAFPLPIRSPYARPILVSLLQLRGGAVLTRLEAALVPAMPQCAAPSGFASARAADVKTALFVILFGLFAGLLLGIGEYFWKNRDIYKSYLNRQMQRLR